MMHFDISPNDFWLDKGELRSSPYCYVCHTSGCRTAHLTEAQTLELRRETHDRRIQAHLRNGLTLEAAQAWEDRVVEVYRRLQDRRKPQ